MYHVSIKDAKSQREVVLWLAKVIDQLIEFINDVQNADTYRSLPTSSRDTYMMDMSTTCKVSTAQATAVLALIIGVDAPLGKAVRELGKLGGSFGTGFVVVIFGVSSYGKLFPHQLEHMIYRRSDEQEDIFISSRGSTTVGTN